MISYYKNVIGDTDRVMMTDQTIQVTIATIINK